MGVYLDYNATTPIDHRVLDEMIDVYKNVPGNADSRTHDFGDAARKVVENAREKVAFLLGVDVGEVFFTSGATESNNIALQGLYDYAEEKNKKHIITSAIEHKAVLETCKHLAGKGFEVDYIKPDITGSINLSDIEKHIRADTLCVSIMHVNNETGTIQPISGMGDLLKDTDVLLHTDATQSCGKLVDEVRTLKYDMLSFSAHKLRGPQGVGALILRKSNYVLPPVKPITFGGQQEHGIRPGTLPAALIAGFGKACEIAFDEYKNNLKRCENVRQELIGILNQSGVEYQFNGDPEKCISSTLNLYFPGVASEALMISTKQYCGISNGSACTSKSYKPSYVLTEMGFDEDHADCSVRVSWGPEVNINEVVDNFSKVIQVAKSLQL